ncbi:aldo/keto reductase [Sediminicola sp. YIK13]|uniref:aldo/keto reductase n=1 Tax=Sediminicola sp. YIK13 TaxID=1453352 RepID=UPI000722249C|nr:aldo/keto reductase [Sediminicola sp. YIK13]ALM08614.1 aldo/keto reductase [Sediminicola sp. YIK13]
MEKTTNYSKIIAGTMTWGSWGKQLSTKEMIDLMQHCIDNGISTFDHADIYGDYTNEIEFGTALSQSKIDRGSIELISKCGIQHTGKTRDNKIKHYNYSKEYIIWSAEQSLQKLKTDYLDLFLLHRPSPLLQPEEVAEAIFQLRKEGKIRDFGVSNFTPSQIALLETAIPVMGNQVEFSLTADAVMYDGTLDDILANKRFGMAWSPLGNYFREDGEQTKRIKKVLAEYQRKYKADESQLLLAWLLQHPAMIHPVVGTTNPKRLKDSIEATSIKLELEDWFELLAASQGHVVP